MNQKLSSKQKLDLINALKTRFEQNQHRHKGIDWEIIHERLESHPEKLAVLYKMEETGGEPDVLWYDKQTDVFIFCDCSKESPPGRRSVCYDQVALDARKKFKPENNAVSMAADIGIELLTETQYRELQQHGPFDTKTSSWLKTPAEIRKLGGALFGDYRYEHIFIYHNGVESYYAARGFRGMLRV